ncbi:MAG: thioesterase family protein [Defluviitaleaceae bacterium]|nr:thioesterase family protein [Defluviitaleaceae bacterium]
MLTTGKTGTAKTVVSEKNTAKTVGSGSLDVFSTPMMIALMEQAACDCLSDSLEHGHTSVGTQISVDHTGASPLNEEITATAEIINIDGRKITFSVTAHCGESQIGNGTHTRFLIDAERFMSKLINR